MVTPDRSVAVVSLPFSDSFDTNAGWMPYGAWTFDTESAYDGGGWRLDGTQRQTISTLTYTALVNLSGVLDPQLVFRQKGNLPTTDLVAVDISLDGQTWVLIDQQIGVKSDWDLHTVELTDYRGQVVRLRLRVATGTQLVEDEPVEGDYRVDNLSIQFVAPPMAAAFVPVDPGPRTMLGLHLVMGAQREPVLDLAHRMRNAGRPLGTVKGTTGTEDILNDVKRASPETIVVYRSQLNNGSLVDCPDTSRPPELEAAVWLAGLEQYWNQVQADYYELMNECLPPVEWLIPFSIEAMRLATQQGRCLLLLSYAGGNPEVAQFTQLLPVYQYALLNPCQSMRYHGIALHSYSGHKNVLLSESDPWMGLRHRKFYEQILPLLPEAAYLPLYLTEAGPGDGRTDFKCEDIARDMMQFTRQLESDPYVKGFHLWTLGTLQEWVNVTPCVPMLGDALLAYYAGR